MIRKCGLFVLSLAVLSSSFSVFFSDVSNAASAYDDLYHTTDNVSVGAYDYYGANCSPTDLSFNFSEYILDTAKYHSSVSTANREAYRDSFLQALDTGRWSVSENRVYMRDAGVTYPDRYHSTVTISWTEDDSLYLNWTADAQSLQVRGTGIKHVNIVTQRVQYGGSSCNPVTRLGEGGIGIVSTRQQPEDIQSTTTNLITATNLLAYIDEDKINYPTDYEGELIRDSFLPPIEYDISYEYDVHDKLGVFQSTTSNEQFDDFDKLTSCYFQVELELSNVYDVIEFDCKTKPAVRYEFQEYGLYHVILFYSYDGTLYNSSIGEPLDVDGGSFSGVVCDAGGTCKKDKNSLEEYFADRQDVGVTAIILAPIMFYRDLPSFATTCSPISFNLMGMAISLPCLGSQMQSWSPFIYGLYQTVVNAVVAFFVALGVVRTIKNTNDPKDDRIEVQKL